MKKRDKDELIEAARKPTDGEVEVQLKALREIVETSDDRCTARMAQAMETAIIWATQETAGWKLPEEEAGLMADVLKSDLNL